MRQINIEKDYDINNYEKKFDIIFSKSLIEHLIQPIKFFEYCKKMLSFLRIPYMPMYEGLTNIKWPNEINKYLRHSNEVMLFCIYKFK